MARRGADLQTPKLSLLYITEAKSSCSCGLIRLHLDLDPWWGEQAKESLWVFFLYVLVDANICLFGDDNCVTIALVSTHVHCALTLRPMLRSRYDHLKVEINEELKIAWPQPSK